MAECAFAHRAGPLALGAGTLPRWQASEQYLTGSRFLAQALRQLISRPQCALGLVGSLPMLPLKPWRDARPATRPGWR